MLPNDPAALLPALHAAYEETEYKRKTQGIVDILARFGLRVATDQSGKQFIPTSDELAQPAHTQGPSSQSLIGGHSVVHTRQARAQCHRP